MVQRYDFEMDVGCFNVVARPSGKWVLAADFAEQQMKLREALREALNAWEGWLEEYHGVGVKVMGCTDRIAELRKLLEGS